MCTTWRQWWLLLIVRTLHLTLSKKGRHLKAKTKFGFVTMVKVMLGVFKRNESKAWHIFGLSLIIHWVLATFLFKLMTIFTYIMWNDRFIGKTRPSDFREKYTICNTTLVGKINFTFHMKTIITSICLMDTTSKDNLIETQYYGLLSETQHQNKV